MNRPPLDLLTLDNANATVQLLGFGETVATAAWRVTLDDGRVRLDLNAKKRPKYFAHALGAVKALRRATAIGGVL